MIPTTKCLTEQKAFDEENEHKIGGLRPTCWEDGNYALEQCYTNGYCNCVDPLSGAAKTKSFLAKAADKPDCELLEKNKPVISRTDAVA